MTRDGRKRVVGRLFWKDVIRRENFNVALSDDGKFSVDIGTGSGVKVSFQHG